MTRIRLTEAKVRDLVAKGCIHAPKLKFPIYRDAEVLGLFIEVSRHSGSYKIQTTMRSAGAKPVSIRRTLGRTSDFSLEEARSWARAQLGAMRRGELPREDNEAPTLRSLYSRYADFRNREHADPVHTANIISNAERHLADWLDLYADKITQEMVEKRHTIIGKARGPYAANHTMKQLRAVYNAKPGLINPVVGIRWFPQTRDPRKGAMLPDDLGAWWQAVEALTNPIRQRFHKLLLFSGMRKGHLRGTRRDQVDLIGRAIRYPKLKAGRPFALPLSPIMVQWVSELMAMPMGPYLFPAESSVGHLMEAREDTLPKTGHDLRRTYASIAAKTSIPQHMREFLVDHTVKGMQGVYQNPEAMFPELLTAQEQISQQLMIHLVGSESCQPGASPVK